MIRYVIKVNTPILGCISLLDVIGDDGPVYFKLKDGTGNDYVTYQTCGVKDLCTHDSTDISLLKNNYYQETGHNRFIVAKTRDDEYGVNIVASYDSRDCPEIISIMDDITMSSYQGVYPQQKDAVKNFYAIVAAASKNGGGDITALRLCNYTIKDKK